jgi:hypothetical protein
VWWTNEADQPMTEINQVLGQELETSIAILVDVAKSAIGVGAAKGDERKALLTKESDACIVASGADDNGAIGAPTVDDLAIGLALGITIGRLGGDEQGIAMAAGLVTDSGEQFAKEGVGEAGAMGRDDEGESIGTLFLELASGDVGVVAHLMGCLLDTLAGFFRDVTVASKGARDSGDREVQSPGDVLERDSHGVSHQELDARIPQGPSKTFWIQDHYIPKRFGSQRFLRIEDARRGLADPQGGTSSGGGRCVRSSGAACGIWAWRGFC